MRERRKIGRGRRIYRHNGRTYYNYQHGHNHLGMKLYDPETGKTIFVRRDFTLLVG